MTVGIAVLSWNNVSDTMECVESVLRLHTQDFILYLVDNGSDESSASELETQVRSLVSRQGQALLVIAGGAATEPSSGQAGDVFLLRNEANLGYAGGNNIAIRRALADGCSGVWILNNDTRVDPGALDAILEIATPGAGMVGVCVLDYDQPDQIQCVGGGTYEWWSTRARMSGAGLPVARISEALGVAVEFVSGSCMYLPRETIETVGELDNRYFLYCEEVDLAERCRRYHRPMLVAAQGRVWHKFGSSAGSSRNVACKSPTSVFHSARSAVLLVRRHRPALMPLAVILRSGYAIWLLLRGHRVLAFAALRGVVSGVAGSVDVLSCGRAASVVRDPNTRSR